LYHHGALYFANPQSAIRNPQSIMLDWKQEIRRRLASLQLAPEREAEIVEELSQHLEDHYAELRASGATPDEAYRAALAEVPNSEMLQRQLRLVERQVAPEPIVLGTNGRKNMIAGLWQDICYGVRSLRKHAMLSTVVIATLTLGIGISTGIFTHLNAHYLRARVDKDPDSFVRIYSAYTRDSEQPGRPGATTLEDYLAFRDRARSLYDVAAWAKFEAPMGHSQGVDDPAGVRALLVTCNFFTLYNLERPLLGRLLQPADCSGSAPITILSEGFWRNRFAADSQIVGKVIHFNGQTVTVVGVTPTFAGQIDRTNVWFPYPLQPYLKLGDNVSNPGEKAWLTVEGRLRQGYSRRESAAELALLAGQQDRLHPGRRTALTVTNGSDIQAPGLGSLLFWVFAVVMCFLIFIVLIVCANVATLLLARGAGRQQEIAVRLALGASRWRLIRMLIVETWLLAAVAGLASIYFAYWLPAFGSRWMSDRLVEWSLAPDWRVFTYLAAVTLLAGTLAGLAPAFQSLKLNLADSLKGRRNLLGGARGGARLRGLLIGAQVALSFVLLAGAGLCVRTYLRMSATDPGFETRQILAIWHWRLNQAEPLEYGYAFYRSFAQRVEGLPGVQGVAYSRRMPFYPGNPPQVQLQTGGQGLRQAELNSVSPNYFTALGIPIVRGRALGEADPHCGMGSCPVVISQRLAREFWPGANPLGQTLRTPQGAVLEVVGVARDTSSRQVGGADSPLIYLPWNPDDGSYIPLVRFAGEAAELSRAAIITFRELMPGAGAEAWTLQSRIDLFVESFRRMELLVGLLGALAVALAVIGIYGVVSFAVSQRTKELGIRIALGARSRDIYSTILKTGVRPIVVGLLIGLLLAWAMASALARSILQSAPFKLDSLDPLAFAGAAALLAAVAVAAMIGPARRATRVDPMLALREE
jgi:predicted permease